MEKIEKIELIVNVNECPKYLDIVAHHTWNEWNDDYITYNNVKSIDDVKSFLSEEICYCYVVDNEVVSLITILKYDIGLHQELSPWIGHLYTCDNHRRHGYATKLLNHVTNIYPHVHLVCYYDHLKIYYETHGFEVKHTVNNYGVHDVIYVMGISKQKN